MIRPIRSLAALAAIALGLVLATCAAHAQSLYWIDTNFASPKLGRSNPDGTSPVTSALTPNSLPEGLASDPAGTHLYWTENAWSGAHVNRVLSNFTGAVALLGGETSMHGLVLDIPHNLMYWTASNLVSSQIKMANLDGTNDAVMQYLPAGSNPRGIVVDELNSRLLWVDYDLGTISSCSSGAPGSNVSTVATASPGLWGIALNAATRQLFVTNYITGTIQTYGPSPTAFVTVLTGLSNPTYLALDAAGGKMYWSEAGAGAQKVQRANLNGTSVQNLGLPVTTFGGLAIGSGSVAAVPQLPDLTPVTELALAPPTPNPARQSTHVEFALPSESQVLLRVMDIQGREIARLAEGEFSAGRHSADWSFSSARAIPAAGLYFMRLEAGGRVKVQRLAVVH